MIVLVRRLSVKRPRNALQRIYKSFIRPHLGYGNVLYDKPSNDNFQNKMEKVQYRACLAITVGIQETSRENFPFQEIYLHRLSSASIIRQIPTRRNSFKGSFFPYCINEWNKLKLGIKKAKSINIFKKSVVRKKKENSLFCICDSLCVKLLTRLRLLFSHLNENRFR